MKSLLLAGCICCCLGVYGQTISRAEYFFDRDPGKGSGLRLSVTQGATINEMHSVSISSLGIGPHTFNYRVVTSNGRWSHFVSRSFFIVNAAINVPASTIRKAEYFFDKDPGTGIATPLTITPNAQQINSFVISLTGLLPGFHQLAVRYQDDLKRWSLFSNRTFYIVPTVTTSLATTINKAEYFFDIDPGPGSATPVPITSGTPQNNLFTIALTGLSSGFHRLVIRYHDNNGKWSLAAARTFYIVPAINLITAGTVKKVEYFFDADPGAGKGTAIPITPASVQNNNFAVDISALSPGFHKMVIRYQDNLNQWSNAGARPFYLLPGAIASANLKRIEYFIDTDPGYGLGTSLSFTPAPQVNQLFNIDLTGVPTGNHKLYVRVKDSRGYWSYVKSGTFTILNCTPPVAPVANNVSRCGTGTLNLTASGATGSQVYRWYADATTTTILSTGATYATPSISSTTIYFVGIYDPSTLCESNRTSVSATIVNIPKPTLNLTGSLKVCAGNSVALSAPAGFVNYAWSNGLTTQQIIATASGSYSVVVSDGNCFSPSSDPFVFTVNPLPPKPTIQASGGGSLCGGGTVTLTAPAGYPIYSWSSGQNTQSIVVNSPGNFTVTVTDANGCQSVVSNVSAVTSSTPSKPVVTVTGNTTLCSGSTVTLGAPAGFSGYTWSNGATSQQIIVSTSGNYSVTVSNGICSSPVSDPVSVTAVTMPSKPVVQVSGVTALCLNSFAVLSAPAGFGTYAWSDAETTRQIVVSTAGNYSVQVGNAANCVSIASDPVVITVTGQPCNNGAPQPPAVANAARCGSGTVQLKASGATGSQAYRWYDLPLAGTLLFTGNTFTTSVLSATTTYYVCTFDPSTGLESNRINAVVTVINLSKPTLNITGSLSLCEGSSTLLSAPTGFAAYLWSNGAVTQGLQVSVAGNYSVQTGNGTCLSPPSDPVTVSVVANPVKPVVTVTGTPTFCGNGSVTLSGPAGFQYRWSNGATTQSVIVTQTSVLSLTVTNSTGCISAASDPVVVTRLTEPCVPNLPPVITARPITSNIEGIASADLTTFVSDPENDIDYSTLRLLSNLTGRGAPAQIDGSYLLTVNYKGLPFTGTDRITLEVCDLQRLCAQKILEIDIVGEVVVFNGITPDGDGKNDFFYIQYVDVVPGAQNNKVTIFDRWGDVVFDISDYDNIARIFTGLTNSGRELPSGNYFYKIDFSSRKSLTGYITLKR